MKKIIIRNGVQVSLGDDAYLTIWEDFDGWNIEVSENNSHMVRVGMKSDEGISFKYVRDLLKIDKD